MVESLFLSKAKAAKVLGVSTQVLREAIQAGVVPVVRLGKRDMIARAALERLTQVPG